MAQPQTSESDRKTLSILAHVLSLFAGFIGPLIILLATPDEEVKNHAKMNLNWVFSFMIYFAVGWVLMIIFILLSFILVGIPFLILDIIALIALGILHWIFVIIAAVRASEGVLWKYPLSIPFFKVN